MRWRLAVGVVLPFDAEEFAGCSVDDVLADPERFVGATLADPLEGVDYGMCKAMIMRAPTAQCGSIASPTAAPSMN